ncbi:ferredoxin [archaeon]|nr:ferredoxin [archaeon]
MFFRKKEKKEEPILENDPATKKKYLIQYNRKTCIGSGTCAAVCPSHWVMEESGKAKLINSQFNEETQLFEKRIDETQLADNKVAADGCPPNCIHITNEDTGEKIS